jgi:hypothetical protein
MLCHLIKEFLSQNDPRNRPFALFRTYKTLNHFSLPRSYETDLKRSRLSAGTPTRKAVWFNISQKFQQWSWRGPAKRPWTLPFQLLPLLNLFKFAYTLQLTQHTHTLITRTPENAWIWYYSLFNCSKLNNEREKLITYITREDNWPIKKSELVNKYLKQVIQFTNSIDYEKL